MNKAGVGTSPNFGADLQQVDILVFGVMLQDTIGFYFVLLEHRVQIIWLTWRIRSDIVSKNTQDWRLVLYCSY